MQLKEKDKHNGIVFNPGAPSQLKKHFELHIKFGSHE